MSTLTIERQMEAVEQLVRCQGIGGLLGLMYHLCKVRAEQGVEVCELTSYKTILDDAIVKTLVIADKHGSNWGRIKPEVNSHDIF